MIYPQLVSYIKESLSKKIPLVQIKKSLLEKGWRESDVNEAIAMSVQSSQPVQSSSSFGGKPIQSSAKNKPQKENSPVLIFGIVGGIVLILIIGFVIYLLLTATPNISDITSGASVDLGSGKEVKFNVNEEEHKIVVGSVGANSVGITIYSSPISLTLSVGQEEKFNLNSDDFYDLLVRLQNITDGKAVLFIQGINEAICVEEWDCTNWTTCINEVQTRVCTDINGCETEEGKPEEIQTCQDLSCVTGFGGKICTSTQNCTGSIVTSSNGNCCLGNCTTIEANLSFISCGANIDCFINASDICNPANLSYDISFSNATWIQDTNYYYKIRGFEGDKCELYQEVIDVTGNFTVAQWTNLTASNYTVGEITSMAGIIISNWAGNSGICRFTTSELEDYIIEVKGGNFSFFTDDEIDDYECTGDLYE